MGPRFLLLLALYFGSQATQAQAVLMFEDQTKSGFKLVMNNFIQNETPLIKLNLQRIPSKENQILVILNDGITIRRSLPKMEKGIHKYVIYSDFKGKRRIRYRGAFSSLQQSALMFSYKEVERFGLEEEDLTIALVDTSSRYQEWSNDLVKETIVLVDSKSLALNDPIEPNVINDKASATEAAKTPKAAPFMILKDSSKNIEASREIKASPKAIATIVEAPIDSSMTAIIAAKIPKEIIQPVDTVSDLEIKELPKTQVGLAKIDTLPQKPIGEVKPNETSVEIARQSMVKTSGTFWIDFKASSFEFDKLQMVKSQLANATFKPEEVVLILQGLKYDQSRLDFLTVLIEKQPELKANEAQFMACIDYELSKQQLKNIFLK